MYFTKSLCEVKRRSPLHKRQRTTWSTFLSSGDERYLIYGHRDRATCDVVLILKVVILEFTRECQLHCCKTFMFCYLFIGVPSLLLVVAVPRVKVTRMTRTTANSERRQKKADWTSTDEHSKFTFIRKWLKSSYHEEKDKKIIYTISVIRGSRRRWLSVIGVGHVWRQSTGKSNIFANLKPIKNRLCQLIRVCSMVGGVCKPWICHFV